MLTIDKNSASLDSVELEIAESVHAGFPSPAADYAGERINLVRELTPHPDTTFYARVSGDSMLEAGIFDGDILIIDKSLLPQNGNIVVAAIDGEFTLKEFKTDPDNNGAWLIPHNDRYSPIHVTEQNTFLIWGVVTFNVHRLCTH